MIGVGEHLNIPVYLHVLWDREDIYRISTKYAAKPSVPLEMVVKENNKKQLSDTKVNNVTKIKQEFNTNVVSKFSSYL